MGFPGIFFVGFALIINSLNMMGKISDKATIPMNIFVASIQIAAAARIMFYTPEATMADYSFVAAILLFAFTYLYVAATKAFNLDGRGLGWYCLPVACYAVPLGVWALPDVGMAILWWMWASLWFMFFLLLALGKNIGKITAWWTLINGVWCLLGSVTTLMGVWVWW